MRSWMIVGAITCAWSATARADQCAVLDDATATRALETIGRHREVVSYCEPCGDVAPEPPTHITLASTQRTAGGRELFVNGRPVDLAYTYVQTSSHRYENLAALVACPTTGVSSSLAVDDATSTGVLIHADPTPVRYTEPTAVRSAAPPAPAPAASAPTIYFVTAPPSHGIGWDAVIAACMATTAVWWLGAGLRRRRAMRPRATDL